MNKCTKDAISWLNKNARYNPDWLDPNKFYFDYPDYAGLPKNIAKKLSSSAVDAIQYNWPEGKWDSKKFRKDMIDSLQVD